MKSRCTAVLERVALGESLAGNQDVENLAPHVAECSQCQKVIAMARMLGAASITGRGAVDPGLGFSARMTVAAQQRLGERRRRRIAATLAASVAVASLAVFLVTRTPAQPEEEPAGIVYPIHPTPEDDHPVALDDRDLAGLVRLADTKRARRVSAPWGRIQKPLAPYMKLVKGVAP